MRMFSFLRTAREGGWLSLVAMVALGVTVLSLLASGSAVWATENQSRLNQTVPTATFTATWTPDVTATPTDTVTPEMTATPTHTATPQPTATLSATLKPGEPTSTPTATSKPGEPTSVPTSTPTPAEATATPTRAPDAPTPTPSSAAPAAEQVGDLVLVQTSSSGLALPGSELTFTLQLTNRGSEELLDVRIVDDLPALLVLKDVAVYGAEMEIAGNQVTIILDRLAPDLPVVITVRVQVALDAKRGAVIDHQPAALYSGVEQKWPMLSIGLPPAELPATGSD